MLPRRQSAAPRLRQDFAVLVHDFATTDRNVKDHIGDGLFLDERRRFRECRLERDWAFVAGRQPPC
jgi:hypothetical protein